jgi:hypothetical protein
MPVTRQSASTASMVDQVGRAIAKAKRGRLRLRSASVSEVGDSGAQAFDPTDRGNGRCSTRGGMVRCVLGDQQSCGFQEGCASDDPGSRWLDERHR